MVSLYNDWPRSFFGLLLAFFSLFAHAQLNITDTSSANLSSEDVVNNLLGVENNASISNISVTGDSRCLGSFTGGDGLGDGALGFDSGIIMGSGLVVDGVGPNVSDETTGEFFLPGDTFLDSLIPGEETFDACVLEFDFECQNAEKVSVDYVMGSEEYNEFVGEGANDVFGFALNGNNISTIPGSGGLPVSIANLNCGNPYDPASPVSPNPPFCDFFINNDMQDGGGGINIEADGLTTVLTAEGDLLAGANHMKFAVADVLDEAFDSWVYIKSGSFRCDVATSPDPVVLRNLLSVSCWAQQNGVAFANEDVLKYNDDTGIFEKFFDGSDVGLAYANMDGFTMLSSGDLLMSLTKQIGVSDIGIVEDEDIIRFTPSTLGVETSGSFAMYFDGSLNGLDEGSVDIGAFHLPEGELSGTDDDGDGILNDQDACPLDAQNDIDGDGICGDVVLYLSLKSSAEINSLWYADEDVIVFNESTGNYSMYFDGSDVGISSADIDALRVLNDGSILMSFLCSATIADIGVVKDEDVVRFIPTSVGDVTDGSFELYLDGSETGLQGNYLDFNALDQIAE